MTAYAIDSALFADQFSTAAMRRVFDDRSTVQRWLDVEVALARAEATLGMIPAEAADEIARAAKAEDIDLAWMKAEMDKTSHPIVPLVRALASLCRDGHGQFAHWGTTTQDIIDTGQILQIRDGLDLVEGTLRDLDAVLRRIAANHRDTVIAGRTHGQQALPITFGYKVAVWITEIGRHLERFAEMRPRLLMVQMAGAVGSFAAMGEQGARVQELTAAELGLGVPPVCWHASRDTIAEMATVVALATGTAGKIAHEIYMLQKTEVAELAEPNPPGKVGSSTMPHKRNPAICESIVALARTTRSVAGLALEGVVAEHERDKMALQAERDFVTRLFCHAHAALTKTLFVVSGLEVNADQMRRNLDLLGGLILSEAIMMQLGRTIGRQNAHDVVHHACTVAVEEGRNLKAVLLEDERVSAHLGEADIDAMMDPAGYTGLCGEMVDRVLAG